VSKREDTPPVQFTADHIGSANAASHKCRRLTDCEQGTSRHSWPSRYVSEEQAPVSARAAAALQAVHALMGNNAEAAAERLTRRLLPVGAKATTSAKSSAETG